MEQGLLIFKIPSQKRKKKRAGRIVFRAQETTGEGHGYYYFIQGQLETKSRERKKKHCTIHTYNYTRFTCNPATLTYSLFTFYEMTANQHIILMENIGRG